MLSSDNPLLVIIDKNYWQMIDILHSTACVIALYKIIEAALLLTHLIMLGETSIVSWHSNHKCSQYWLVLYLGILIWFSNSLFNLKDFILFIEFWFFWKLFFINIFIDHFIPFFTIYIFLDASASLEPALRVPRTFGLVHIIQDSTFEILKNKFFEIKKVQKNVFLLFFNF